MKRYTTPLDPGNNSFEETPDGDWVYHGDLSAHMLKLREVARLIPHDPACVPDDGYHGHGCVPECIHGQALRLLGEVL